MAAYDRVSNIKIRPLNRTSYIDFRTARLPNHLLTDHYHTFDPYEYREPKNPISLWMAYLNLFRIGFGAGVLGIPLAISQIGIVLGPLLSIFTGLLIVHTHMMLLNCLYEISRRLKIPTISYRYGFRIALLNGPPICQSIGKYGPCIIGTFMLLSQIGICTVFVLFTSDSLRDIMDWQSSRPALLVLLLPYLLLEYFMKSLKIISYVSMLGNVMNAVGMALVFYHIFEDPHGNPVMAVTEALPVMFAFGSFMFNMSAIGVVLSLESALAHPQYMTSTFGVINVGILVPVLVATVFGALGYWAFGNMEENVLRFLPFDSITAMASMGLYLLAIAFAYPIQLVPAVSIMMEIIKNHDPMHEPSDAFLASCRNIIRPLFVATSFTIAYLVPYQGPIVAFVGNLCTTLLALVFPAMMEICIIYPGSYGKFNYYLWKDLLIMLIGIAAWIFGVGLCGYLIYVRLGTSVSADDNDVLILHNNEIL